MILANLLPVAWQRSLMLMSMPFGARSSAPPGFLASLDLAAVAVEEQGLHGCLYGQCAKEGTQDSAT